MIVNCHTHTPDPKSIFSVQPDDFSPLEGITFSVGIHPWTTDDKSVFDYNRLEAIARLKCVAAIGETGIDHHKGASEAVQTAVFAHHVQVSENVEKPLILHVVKALDTILALRKHLKPKQIWIWHGFRGNEQMARQIIHQNIYLSLGEHFNPEAARTIPSEYLLLETDCSPLTIKEIARQIAIVRNTDTESLIRLAENNLNRILHQS